MARKKVYSAKKAVRRIARERVGSVPETQVMVPKKLKKPKHKETYQEEGNGS